MHVAMSYGVCAFYLHFSSDTYRVSEYISSVNRFDEDVVRINSLNIKKKKENEDWSVINTVFCFKNKLINNMLIFHNFDITLMERNYVRKCTIILRNINNKITYLNSIF